MSYVVLVITNNPKNRDIAYECEDYKKATIKLNTLFQKRLKEEITEGSALSKQNTVSKEGYAKIVWMDGSFQEFRVAELIKKKE